MVLSISDFDTTNDGEWYTVLHQLTIQTKKYEGLTKRKDAAERKRTSLEILALLRRASEIHPDSGVRSKFRMDAEAWERGDRKGVKNKLRPFKLFMQGSTLIVTAPLLMAGIILYGTGKLIAGIGDMLAFGQLDKFVSGTILE